MIFLVLVGFLTLAVDGADDLSENTLQKISANEILRQIKDNNSVEYYKVIISDDLDLSKLDLPTKHVNRSLYDVEILGLPETQKVITSPIRINHAVIVGKVNLNNIIFNGPIDFSFTSFNSDADFGFSTFNDTADFVKSTFKGDASFERSTFDHTANFWLSNFDHTTSFERSTFKSDPNFLGSIFNGRADLMYSTFKGRASFEDARFNSDANFGFSTFEDDASFERSTFKGRADFDDSRSNSYADFRLSTFEDDASFERSTFNSDVSFEQSTFEGDARFGRSTFNSDASFRQSGFQKNASFTDSKFSRNTSFNNASFGTGVLLVGEDSVFYNLDLNKANIDSIDTYIRWDNIKNNLDYNIKIYNIFFDNYKKWRLFDDYNKCYYKFRVESFNREPLSLGKLFDFTLWILYGFGLRPDFPIAWSIAIIFISGFIFYGTNGVQKSDNAKGTISKGDALIFSAIYFTSGASNIISPQPTELSPVGKSRFVAILERLLGWFFFALFLTSLGNMVTH